MMMEPPAWLKKINPEVALKIWLGLFAVGSFEVVRIVLTIAGEMLSTGK